MAEYMTGVDRCVCCGAAIPEGGWICPNCLVYVKEEEDGKM
jgi:predicted nucleic acid-binding Zn ribbon protein